jgi:DNA polymerase-3 subunit beta
MKFVASNTTLLKTLSSLLSAIPSNPMMPLLENFLFDIQDGILSVTASDSQTTLVSKISIEADSNGSICVPARMLTETLKALPEQPVTITINEESFTVEISSDNGKYKIAGENADDYIAVPTLDRSDEIDLPSGILNDALTYTIFATSNDEMKPAMNGVYFQLEEGQFNFVSSDSHRLIRYQRKDISSPNDASFIVPKKAVNLLKSLLPSQTTTVNLSYNESTAIFRFENTTLISRLIEERFPPYQNVIPASTEKKATINRVDLLNCLKRINIFSNKSTHQVRFKFTGSELKVSAEDIEFSNEASERLSCEFDGDDMEIGFNAKLFMEILQNLNNERIELLMNAPSTAGLVVPEDQPEDEDLLMLVMPIVLSNNYA